MSGGRKQAPLFMNDALPTAYRSPDSSDTSSSTQDVGRIERMVAATRWDDAGAWTLAAVSREMATSGSFRRMLGRDPASPFGFATLLEIVDPLDRERVVAALDASLAAGDDLEVQYRIGQGAAIRWIDMRAQATRDAANDIAGLSGLAIDITNSRSGDARRVAEAAFSERLRELDAPEDIAYAAAELLGTTLGVSRAGYGTVDPVAETITIERDWNAPGIESLAGVLHFRDYGTYIEDLKQGRTAVVEDADQDPRTASTAAALKLINAHALINMPVTEYGGLVGLLYLNHDTPRHWSHRDLALMREVAERTRSAVARRIAEQKLRALATSLEEQVAERTRERDRTWNRSQDLLVVIDARGALRELNPAWTRVLGWQRSDLVERQFRDLMHPDDRAVGERIMAVADDRDSLAFEARLRHRDGRYRWISWVASRDGEFVYASGRHVTDEKEAAIELAAAQEQLRQSQKMEAVGQLTGGLAHDFNNLLTGISGSLELLKMRSAQGRSGADLDRYILAAQGAAKRAAALTHRLLAFARRQTLDPRPTDINRLVTDMEELIQRSTGPSVSLEVVGSPGLWPALVDANQLENAVLNLCINARDAMPDGGRVVLETANRWLDDRSGREHEIPAGQYVLIRVSDSGTGMTQDVIERAFDPFFTTKPLGAGTGLGLSMVYGFARQSGGQVRIYSEVGQGTTVSIYLPRYIGAQDRVDGDGEAGREPVPWGNHETVLIVDDEPTVRMLVMEVLDDFGYVGIEAADGAAGLRILQSEQRLDLLITDVGLPGGINGRQVADAGRAARPTLKVLFITGYADNAVVGNGHLDPGMEVLTKPFAVDVLAHRIKALVTRA